jgi:hypothetical protein
MPHVNQGTGPTTFYKEHCHEIVNAADLRLTLNR